MKSLNKMLRVSNVMKDLHPKIWDFPPTWQVLPGPQEILSSHDRYDNYLARHYKLLFNGTRIAFVARRIS